MHRDSADSAKVSKVDFSYKNRDHTILNESSSSDSSVKRLRAPLEDLPIVTVESVEQGQQRSVRNNATHKPEPIAKGRPASPLPLINDPTVKVRSKSPVPQSASSDELPVHHLDHGPFDVNELPSKVKNRMSMLDRARSISPHARAILQRTFSRSRSLSRSRVGDGDDDISVGSSGSSSTGKNATNRQALLVAVTSCRSDAYHAHKAPGATSMLPRKAPSALKSFHELAVGVKDAYEAMGAMPIKLDLTSIEYQNMSQQEKDGKTILWEFMGNLDFLLSLVDEVATDSVTRGALKDDSSFKALRDVIKKCNKVLEQMLVRRERKYTLFFRIVQPHDTKDLRKMKSWNAKVEAAVGGITNDAKESAIAVTDIGSDTDSSKSAFSGNHESSTSIFQRGRTLLPTAGRIRARRATPTPIMRHRFKTGSDVSTSSADDGFSTITAPVTSVNIAKLQKSISEGDESQLNIPDKFVFTGPPIPSQTTLAQGFAPKDELVDVIVGLRKEKLNKQSDVVGAAVTENFSANWLPKADIPSLVPKLPVEYVHRHRLMKQVVNSLIGRLDAEIPKEGEETVIGNHHITCITSRHTDKAGNGKTTLAVAAIQTVEVRERFPDGIAWIQLGRRALSEKDIRRLYEELYDQLLSDELSIRAISKEEGKDIFVRQNGTASAKSEVIDKNVRVSDSSAVLPATAFVPERCRRIFLGGDLEGIKEDFALILSQRRVLICLDDVWRLEDAAWFLFDGAIMETVQHGGTKTFITKCDPCHHFLITTRTPGLIGTSNINQVFVRILSEHEAVKLFLLSAGRRMPVGKNSTVFNQARMIVKGCGNCPLALRLAGAMLRVTNRNWTLSSPTWTVLVEQCKYSLDEASRLRSFSNTLIRLVDLSFVVISDITLRIAIRRCFVSFAIVFFDCDWVSSGRGIPKGVVVSLFSLVLSLMLSDDVDRSLESKQGISVDHVIDTLEHLNLLQRARHGAKSVPIEAQDSEGKRGTGKIMSKTLLNGSLDGDEGDFVDSTSQRDMFSSEKDISSAESPSYLMNESIKYIAENMASRKSYSYAPKPDDFTAFASQLDVEVKKVNKTGNLNWLENAARYLFNGQSEEHSVATTERFHELAASALLGVGKEITERNIAHLLITTKKCATLQQGELYTEKYVTTFLPSHLLKARMYPCTRAVLTDSEFIRRRIEALGPLEATRRHVSDLLEFRINFASSETSNHSNLVEYSGMNCELQENIESDINDEGSSKPGSSLDVNSIHREASKAVMDEIYKGSDMESNSEDSLTMALCLSVIGDGYFKARLWKDAMLRLEEANAIFRALFGSYHVDVARSVNAVGRALVKLGENRGALLKFSESARIFDTCGASLHFDALSNTQMMANLLTECGDIDKAESKYNEIIAAKKSIYGSYHICVVKVLYDHGVVLARCGQLDAALRQYESALSILENSHDIQSSSLCTDIFTCKNSFDVTLIALNIASLKSKKSDYHGAISSYEKAIALLRRHLEFESDLYKIASHKRHMVSAIGRLGSLKMKLRDNTGALETYLMLIREVDGSSSESSKRERAKAHVKCATIFRQMGTISENASSIEHLKEALQMYTILHGSGHKDTKAIASSLQQWQSQDAIRSH